MLFSASFMAAGIQQIPLQLFWKMQKLTIALSLSRIAQIIVLFVVIFYLYPKMVFN